MPNKKMILVCALLVAVALVGLTPVAAQGGSVAAPDVTEGDQLLHENFNSSKAWEKYASDDGVDFGVSGGVYVMQMPESMGSSFVWAVNATEHTDVIIQATFIPRVENADSEFGLMCRADAAGFGYYFVISGEGAGYIAKGVEDKVQRLTDPVESEAIITGTDANTLRVICAGDYLALYVNDELVAEANDDEFTAGLTGLAASSGGNQDADVTVDDLDIYEAVVSDTSTPVRPTPVDNGNDNVTAPEIDGVEVGDVLLNESFDSPDSWERYDASDDKSHFRVEDGVYSATTTKESTFIFGQNSTTNDDYVVTVEVTLEDGPINNAQGVICRASDDGHGNGYYFAISSDGYYTIQRFDEDADQAVVLVEWDKSSAINQGEVTNTLTVACVDDYLAFYANGVLLADVRDDTYDEGITALLIAEFDPGEVRFSFDNLTIFDAESA